jgi:MSHA biogenesis protein MshQ
MGQGNLSLSYGFQAENINNAVVTNYGPTYSLTLATPTYSVENLDNGTDLNMLNGGVARFLVATKPTWASGMLSLPTSFGNFARLIVSGVVTPDGSYESAVVGVKLTDTLDNRVIRSADLNTNPLTTGSCATGGSCTNVALGSPLKFRYGRMRLDDAFGPESVSLPVNFVTEYWVGNRFVVNANDSCTLLPRSVVTFPKGPVSTDANRTVDLTGGSTQGAYTNLTATTIGFNAGSAGQVFTAPTNAAQGSFVVSVDLTAMPWLTFDWDQGKTSGPDTKLPDATFTFGSYRGNDRVIYWRERLQ